MPTQQPHIRHESMLHIMRGAMVAAGMRELSLTIMGMTIGASGLRGLPVQSVRRHESTPGSDQGATWADIVNA